MSPITVAITCTICTNHFKLDFTVSKGESTGHLIMPRAPRLSGSTSPLLILAMGEVAPVAGSTSTLHEDLAQLRLVVAAPAPRPPPRPPAGARDSMWVFRQHACTDGHDEIAQSRWLRLIWLKLPSSSMFFRLGLDSLRMESLTHVTLLVCLVLTLPLPIMPPAIEASILILAVTKASKFSA
jgi:hypothetical protein